MEYAEAGATKEHTADSEYKSRVHVFPSSELISELDDKLSKSLLPEVRKVFYSDISYREIYKICSYHGKDGGTFGKHRDTVDKQLHRRYAISISLNDDYQGGGILFPEYSDEIISIPKYGAVVFPGSLYHQVAKISSGTRWVIISFLFTERESRGERDNKHRFRYQQDQRGLSLKSLMPREFPSKTPGPASPALQYRPVQEIPLEEMERQLRKDQPFIVRNWIPKEEGWILKSRSWRRVVGKVTVVPPEVDTVSEASYVLRRKSSTVEMTYRELFSRIEGKKSWKPVRKKGENYYLFGGSIPSRLLKKFPWPKDLKYRGASPYIASAGISAKAHYDHWWALLVQVHGKKTVKLFPPSDYSNLYPTHDRSSSTPRRALVDLNNLDFEQFPRLKKLEGQLAQLEAGDILYIPINWWHEITSTEFSIGFNRRLRLGSGRWLRALLAYYYHLIKGRVLYRVKPVPTHEMQRFAQSTRKAFKRDWKRYFKGRKTE
jgi:predicted 2-oxoglutarate/Fe(II)-dependent dioxygenase YbiX